MRHVGPLARRIGFDRRFNALVKCRLVASWLVVLAHAFGATGGAATLDQSPDPDSVAALQESCRPPADPKLGVDLRPDARERVQTCEALLRIRPEEVEAYRHLGSAYVILEQYVDALDAYERGLATEPRHWGLQYQAALMLNVLNRHTEVVDAAHRLIALRPGNAEPYGMAAWALLHLGRYAEAMAYYRAALGVDPTVAAYWGGLAQAAAGLDHHAEAVAFWNRANRLHPAGDFVGEAGEREAYARSLSLAGPQPVATLEWENVERWNVTQFLAVSLLGVVALMLLYGLVLGLKRRRS